MVVFRELVADTNPASLDVALDVLQENRITLYEVSVASYHEQFEWIEKTHPLFKGTEIGARGWFEWGEGGDFTDVVWAVERDHDQSIRDSWRIQFFGHFHNRRWFFEAGRRYRDLDEAIERAVVDAWFCVYLMHVRWNERVGMTIDRITAGARGEYDDKTIDLFPTFHRYRTVIYRKATDNPPAGTPPPGREQRTRFGVFSASKRQGPAEGRHRTWVADDLDDAEAKHRARHPEEPLEEIVELEDPRRRNPPLTKEDAFLEFGQLIRDPDPAVMAIAEDLVLVHKLSLVELSALGDAHRRSGNESGLFTLSPLHPADAPLVRVQWLVESVFHHSTYLGRSEGRGAQHFAKGLKFMWLNQDEWLVVPNAHTAYFTSRDAARRAAAADAWAVAKTLKQYPPDPAIDIAKIRVALTQALVAADTTAPEIYEHVKTRRKPPTFLEAREDLLAALRRAGWNLSEPGLRLPYATTPNGVLRLWFKPQAVHYTILHGNTTRHNARETHSVSYDLDIRKVTPTDFIAQMQRSFPRGFR